MTRVETFQQHFDALAGKRPDHVYFNDTEQGARISVLVYRDVPEPGMLIGVTYGLSLLEHPDWQFGRPELMIAVRSTDDRWARAMGLLAANLAGESTFSYGDLLSFGQGITAESPMDAFIIFAPTLLEEADYLNVLETPEGAPVADVINVAGIYPIHAAEMQAIQTGGLENFWKSGADLYDVRRAPIPAADPE